MELELGLAQPNPHAPGGGDGGGEYFGLLDGASMGAACGKRAFGEAFCRGEKATLPLFVATGTAAAPAMASTVKRATSECLGAPRPGGGGGISPPRRRCILVARARHRARHQRARRKRLVGWPPVKCAHRRSYCGGGGGYVKVRMEGMAIGQKVDVSLHGSYEELLRTLARMFPSTTNKGAGADAEGEAAAATQDGERRRRGHHPYVVTYEDGEGDWLLVGDVPWEDFAKSVKRLKILA
ncbi:auxin-responsive protein IAA20-like [Panicum miliaceum]|uniref:Auxin-responsive protein n=1 Tax=Panicum miliaceum TaxID=4540 RepID=A0A3L6RZ13_PANMI|nr:auxin-responsive protein IAA20-like [Panicum miliaceum]